MAVPELLDIVFKDIAQVSYNTAVARISCDSPYPKLGPNPAVVQRSVTYVSGNNEMEHRINSVFAVEARQPCGPTCRGQCGRVQVVIDRPPPVLAVCLNDVVNLVQAGETELFGPVTFNYATATGRQDKKYRMIGCIIYLTNSKHWIARWESPNGIV